MDNKCSVMLPRDGRGAAPHGKRMGAISSWDWCAAGRRSGYEWRTRRRGWTDRWPTEEQEGNRRM